MLRASTGQLICNSLTLPIRERLTSPYVRDNYDTATSPYAKFKLADTVVPAREAYEVRSLKQLGGRWGSGEVARVSTQGTAGSTRGESTKASAVSSQKASPADKELSVPLANDKERSISPLRAEMDP